MLFRSEITGEPKEINKLLKKIERTPNEETNHYSQSLFAFNNVIPEPAEGLENGAWYNWRIENWGTKWECADSELRHTWEQGHETILFNTAWSPAEPIVDKLAKEFKKLSFEWKFYEESNAYWGHIFYEKGERVDVYEGEFNTCAEYQMFGLEHHTCKVCENYVYEFCDNSDNREIESCPECQEKQEAIEKEVWEADTSLWEGEEANA